MPSEKPLLVVLHGPTAVGKTALAVELAKAYGTEVISSDSRQFYREMSIGTAKVTSEEMQGVPHHFVDFLSVKEEFNAGSFENEAIKLLNELFQEHAVVVMAGGSGLYAEAVLRGLDDLPGDESIRQELIKRLESEGLESLQNELKEKDPEYFENVDEQNPHRVIRALEVINASGKKYSELRRGKAKERSFDFVEIALTRPREVLYDRINRRVDKMMEAGLLDEVRSLYELRHLQALNTVGYKEFFSFLGDEFSLEEAIELVKRNTRRFAKRQMTWLRKFDSMYWIDMDKEKSALDRCKSIIEQKLQE